MPFNSINVAIADDHTLFRKTLKDFISGQKNINVVVQSPDLTDLLYKLKNNYVQVLLMDEFMPKLNGAEAVKQIRHEYPEIKILILSMRTDMELLSDLMDLGVYGYFSKADEPEELIHAIVTLSEQRIYRNKMFTEVMYWSRQNDIKMNISAANVSLSDREKQVLQLLWDEKSNKEIADHLFLSVRSVEKMRQDLKEKLGVKTTIGMLKYAMSTKIIGHSYELSCNYALENRKAVKVR
jgi:DNA-binding NarL/FixJ family response regulator